MSAGDRVKQLAAKRQAMAAGARPAVAPPKGRAGLAGV
jgi:hypothetical protein